MNRKFHTICTNLEKEKVVEKKQCIRTKRRNEHIKAVPELTTTKYIIKDAVAEGWAEEYVEYVQSHAQITAAGVEYMKKTTPVLLAALERSFFVFEQYMNDLYGEIPSSVSEVDEIGIESLFDNGGIRNLYRTLFLHTLAHRKEKRGYL